MIAVICVRAGVLPVGAAEAVAEAGHRAVVAGSGTEPAAAEVGGECTCVELGAYGPARFAAALAPIVRDEDIVILPASPDGRDVAPRLAARLDRPLFAGAIKISADRVDLVRRGGRIIETVVPIGPFVATLQPGVRGAQSRAAGRAQLIVTTATTRDPEVLAELPADAASIDLSEADRIVGGGAGLDAAERFAQLTRFGHAIDAAMGATRVVTDRGWVGHERQIGTTGVVVSPKLYVNFGISGAVQHTSGLGDPEHIISVNRDPHCPMMAMADLAIVTDANQVLTHLVGLTNNADQ